LVQIFSSAPCFHSPSIMLFRQGERPSFIPVQNKTAMLISLGTKHRRFILFGRGRTAKKIRTECISSLHLETVVNNSGVLRYGYVTFSCSDSAFCTTFNFLYR
jgi:hypothetical protein